MTVERQTGRGTKHTDAEAGIDSQPRDGGGAPATERRVAGFSDSVTRCKRCTCELGLVLQSRDDAAPPLPRPPELLQLLRPVAVFGVESPALHPQRLCGHTHIAEARWHVKVQFNHNA